MKKIFILISMLAVAILAACNREQLAPEEPEGIDLRDYSFNITVNRPDVFEADANKETKGVKTDWEVGDRIFLISPDEYGFSNGCLCFSITYDGTKWNLEDSDWKFFNNNGYYIYAINAVYFPYEIETLIGGTGVSLGNLMYENIKRTYHLEDSEAAFIIDRDNLVVSISLNMTLPDGYVQFFIPDDNPVDGKYALQEPSISSYHYVYVVGNYWYECGALTENETDSYPTTGVEMPGMATTIDGETGYYFWGKIPAAKRGVESTYDLRLKEYDSEGNLISIKNKSFNKTLYAKENEVLTKAAVKLNMDSGWLDEPAGTI